MNNITFTAIKTEMSVKWRQSGKTTIDIFSPFILIWQTCVMEQHAIPPTPERHI